MPAFAFFCFYFVTKKDWLLLGIALSEAPCNAPALIFANFPSFLLALLAWILLLLPNKDVSRPASIPEPSLLTAWQSSPATFAGWKRVVWLSLCPAAPSLLAVRQVQARLTVCWDPALSPRGGNQKKRLCREPCHEVGFCCAICARDFPLPRAAGSVASIEGLTGASLRFDTRPLPSIWAMVWCRCSFSPTLKYHSWEVAVAAGSTRNILSLCAPLQVFALSSFLACCRCTPKDHHSSKTWQRTNNL